MAPQISLYTLLARDVSLEEAVRLAADAGFDAVDIRQRHDGIHILPEISDDEAEDARDMVEEAGLHVSGLTTYWEIGLVEREAAAEQLANIERSLHTAGILGARFMRVSSGDYDRRYDYEVCRAAFRDQMMRVAEMAAAHEIVVTPEQHGGRYIASAGQCMDMLRGLEHPYLGVVFDPGNAVSEGFERPWVQVRMLGGWIRNVHVKNRMTAEGEALSHERLPGGNVRVNEGVLDWDEIADELAAIGYDGYLTAEDFAQFDSLEEKFAWNACFLRRLAAHWE
ncbi:MAG: sugar phosphate isomerase/epimerase family protein [Armatimonadota bacterium]|nr:sugar phosphate isomerase/epimerase family protein [Armatimonadota bacterium]